MRDDDDEEESYDEEYSGEESGSDLENDDLDDVEWNSRVSAMTGRYDRKNRHGDGKGGGSGAPSRRDGNGGCNDYASGQQRRTATSNKSAPVQSNLDGDAAQDLGLTSLPAIFKTPDGACAVDIPLAGVQSADALLDAIVHLGSAMVDADISASTIKVHYATRPGSRPRKLTKDTNILGLRSATGIIVTPAAK